MLNNFNIQGRLTRDPELRYTPSGVAVTTFTLAHNTGRKREDGSEIAYFIDCVAWRNTAEFASKYFQKGQQAIAEGELETRTYEKDGIKRKVTELNVRKLHFADSKKDADQGEDTRYDSGGFTEVDADDDLPF